MWKVLEISQETYFFLCNFNNNTQDVTFILYNLNTSWSQTLNLQEVKQKVKFLNKRFDFNEDNIKEALLNGSIQSAVIEKQPNTTATNSEICLLKLKYRVKNCFLNYEWTLRKQKLEEFQQTFVQPLLLALLSCHQQVEILTDTIRKKDIELKQFRIEGAVLNRKTVVTKPFDFENFTKKYEQCNETAINFRELGKYLQENSRKAFEINKDFNVNNMLEVTEPGEKLHDDQSVKTKISPRQKKRKVNELRMKYLEQHLKIRKLGLEYESSQSQTSNCSQPIEESVIKDIKQQKQNISKQDEISKSENVTSPRRSPRCAPIKQKPDIMSREVKNDSDKDNHLRTLRERKTKRNLVNLPKDSSTNSSKDKTESNSKNINTEKITRNCVNSLNNRMKSPEISSEVSNIFNFLTNNEDITFTKRNNLLKNTSEKDISELKEKKLLPNKDSLSCNNDSEIMNIKTPVLDYISADSMVSIRSPIQNKILSQSPIPLAINEISLQLNNIKKELESLEAMRLADLKQRICKV